MAARAHSSMNALHHFCPQSFLIPDAMLFSQEFVLKSFNSPLFRFVFALEVRDLLPQFIGKIARVVLRMSFRAIEQFVCLPHAALMVGSHPESHTAVAAVFNNQCFKKCLCCHFSISLWVCQRPNIFLRRLISLRLIR